MPEWTTRQVAILEEFAPMGPQAVADEIQRQTGVKRSARAVEVQASRLCISLARYQTCSGCGRRVHRLNRNTGLCKTCNARHLRDRQLKAKADLSALRKELEEDESESPEFKRYWREYRAASRAIERME